MKKLTLMLAGGLAATGCASVRQAEPVPDIVISAPEPLPQPPAPPPPPPPPPMPPPAPTRAPDFPIFESSQGDDPFDDEASMGAPVVGSSGAEAGDTAPVEAIDFLPYTSVGQVPVAQQLDPSGDSLVALYTRIRIVNDRKSAELTRDPDSDGISGFGVTEDKRAQRDYREESRGWLARRMGSRKITRAFLVEFDIDDPDITAATALFSASFESDVSKGEAWSTDESLSAFATPWFRVGPNTVLNSTFKLKLATEGDADVGANVVSALNTAAMLIAPIAPVVTMFTAPEITSAANFLDSSVSNLFGRSIDETTTTALALRAWTPEPIFFIDLNLPAGNDIKDGSRKVQAGRWAVYLDRPLVSIFVGAQSLYEVDPDAIDPAAILSFRIGTDLTVHDYVFARLDLTDRIDAINTAAAMGDTASAAAEARKVCNRVGRGLSEVGLNAVDVAIAWWALGESESFAAEAVPVLRDPELCLPARLWSDIAG